jgi:hypothetical protein
MAKLKEKEILELLLEEIQSKKKFQPYKATSCDFCSLDIEESDDFYFVEGRRKMCGDCLDEITTYLEDKMNEL